MFRRNMIEARALREAQEAAKAADRLEKKALQRQMADRFEADVKSVVGAVAQATADMQRVAGRDHGKRQRHLGAGRSSGRGFRGGLGQRQHGCRRHRGAGLFGGRDRPSGHPFQRRRR